MTVSQRYVLTLPARFGRTNDQHIDAILHIAPIARETNLPWQAALTRCNWWRFETRGPLGITPSIIALFGRYSYCLQHPPAKRLPPRGVPPRKRGLLFQQWALPSNASRDWQRRVGSPLPLFAALFRPALTRLCFS